MSRFPFVWETLPSQRKHKDFAVAAFPTLRVGGSSESENLPLVLAACHLTKGLFDGAIVAKKNELQKLINHLSAHFPGQFGHQLAHNRNSTEDAGCVRSRVPIPL